MLPFLKHRDDGVGVGSTSAIQRKPDEDDMSDMDLLDVISQDLISGVEAKDPHTVRSALESLVSHIMDLDMEQDEAMIAPEEPQVLKELAEGGDVVGMEDSNGLEELHQVCREIIDFIREQSEDHSERLSSLEERLEDVLSRLEAKKEEPKEEESNEKKISVTVSIPKESL